MSGNHAGLTRRQMLGGATAAAVGAVLLKDIPAARARVVTDLVPHPPVGVTLDTGLFPRGTSMTAALREWQQITGCAPQSAKVYYQHRQFPTRPQYNDKVAACIQLGMTAVLCFKPGYRPFRKSDAAALERSLAAHKAAGLRDAVVVLWTEQQSKHYRPRMTAAEFIAGSRFYASAARSAGWPVYWNSLGWKSSYWAPWCPGDAVDGYSLDGYASGGNWRDIWAPGGIARMADRDGKPFGWFEMGIAAGTTARPSVAAITSYVTESAAYLASRKPGTTGPIVWWSGNTRNALIPATRFPQNAWIARQLYPKLYHALAA